MNEKADRMKLRFNSERGLLTKEDLWDLSLPQLNVMAKRLKRELASTAEEDFLEVENKEDAKIRLAFDIVLHILKTKKAESEKRKEATERKAEKEKLLSILSKKQDESLENMSEDELKKKLAELD